MSSQRSKKKIFSLEKVSNLSDIAFLSTAVKIIVSLANLDNWKFLWRTSHPVVSAAGESAASFTLVKNVHNYNLCYYIEKRLCTSGQDLP